MSLSGRLTRRGILTLWLWLLALALFAWTLGQLPLSDIGAQLRLLTGKDWLLWFLVNICILYFAVRRWQLLGQALQARLSLSALFRLRQAGSAVSFLTPGPHFGGEPLQLYWLYRYHATPLHRAVAMLGTDRFFETGINIVVLLAGVLVLSGIAMVPFREWLSVVAILIGVLCALLLAVALVLRHPDWLAKRLSPLMRRLCAGLAVYGGQAAGDGGWQRDSADLSRGWRSLVKLLISALMKHRPTLWLALLLSIAGWGALLVELALLMDFLGLTPSPRAIALIMVGMRLAMLLPVPGGIGTIEASLLWSFQYLGLSGDAAVGLIALIRLRDTLVLLIGMGCLYGYHRPRRQRETALAE
ncbi:MAG: lysylphosphatidylglycerol synthase transmembrane domain-containing protein [Chromatocurvus sp.]